MPDINWTTLSPPNSRDNEVLIHLANLGLNQVIDVATHKDGSTLDLIFLNLAKSILHSILKYFFRSLSRGFPDTISISTEPISCEKSYSKSSFKPAICNENLTFFLTCCRKISHPLSSSVYGITNFSMPRHNVHMFPITIYPIVCI